MDGRTDHESVFPYSGSDSAYMSITKIELYATLEFHEVFPPLEITKSANI